MCSCFRADGKSESFRRRSLARTEEGQGAKNDPRLIQIDRCQGFAYIAMYVYFNVSTEDNWRRHSFIHQCQRLPCPTLLSTKPWGSSPSSSACASPRGNPRTLSGPLLCVLSVAQAALPLPMRVRLRVQTNHAQCHPLTRLARASRNDAARHAGVARRNQPARRALPGLAKSRLTW